MNKISDNYFKDFSINITKYATLPSLSLALYGSWFYKNTKDTIKIIKGPLEYLLDKLTFEVIVIYL